jgi:hypothetical protein
MKSLSVKSSVGDDAVGEVIVGEVSVGEVIATPKKFMILNCKLSI